MDLLQTAIDLAYKLHAGQYRKGLRLPYIVHPCDVFRQLLRWGVKEETTLAAALLHDVFALYLITPYTLSLAVGMIVTDVVEELTVPGDEHNKVLKAAYMASFAVKSTRALVIKAADRYCNVQDSLLTEPLYARKYFHLADPLFFALGQRKDEINGKFGKGVAYNMMFAFNRLEESLP